VEAAMLKPLRFALVSVVAVLAGVAAASQPVVVSASPDLGDSDVDPTLTQLRIEFDQDMDTRGGMSICGGGPRFPNLTGKGKWDSPRVLLVPVKLEPSHTYELSINCPAAQNSRSANGEPAMVTPISFTTAASKEAAKTLIIEPVQNERAVVALRTALAERYSHRDVRLVDWDGEIGAHLGELQRAKTRGQFARAAARVLSIGRDVHMSLGVGNARIATFSPMQAPNSSTRWLAANVPQWRQANEVVFTGVCTDGVAYILIGSWPGEAKLVQPALDFIEQHKDAPGLIIDVRPNGGGDEGTARMIAACFIEKPAVYARNRYRDPGGKDGWSDVFDRTIEPAKDGLHFKGPVAVLMGPSCMSSNESFLLMMRQCPRAKLVGEASYGTSGNPKPIDLGNGVTIFMPSWKDMLPDGTPLEGRGVLPDVSIRAKPDELAVGDPVLDAGLRIVRAR
jgi:carboxyl-terminal processing protease